MSVDWNSIGIGCVMTAVAHPFTYTKVLVQLGHEPLSPVLGRNMFFRKQYQFPSVFQYMKHIQNTDGYIGLYRGLMPRICANAATSITYSLVAANIGINKNKDESSVNADGRTTLSLVCKQTFLDMSARCTAIVVSQPFHVIAVRTMAQFIGHETIYNNMYASVIEIYTEEGVLGFFAGIAPRMAGEVISIWLCNVLSYLVNTYVLTDSSELRDLRQYTQMVMSYLAQTLTYPLSLTGTVMAVNGANLAASKPPLCLKYDGWISCIRDLHRKGLASRGSSMLFRKAVSHALAAQSVSPTPVY